MKNNDSIEELFQKRNKEAVGEKPRDLVWKRIESGLNTENKKRRTVREFVSSVWFSAAVFALIAIPYFIFFVENLNSFNENDSIEVVKMDDFPEEQAIVTTKQLDIVEEVEDKNKKEVIVVKNKDNDLVNKPILPKKEVIVLTETKTEKQKTLDSIENKGLYAVNSRMKVNRDEHKDSANFRKLDESFSISNSYYKQREDKTNKEIQSNSKSAVPIIQSSDKPMDISTINNSTDEDVKIIYKPLKFTAKTKILRTNFKLLDKSKNTISFVNNSIIISFEKVHNEIILKTNEPKMSFELLDLLEKNKKDIFNHYQSIE
ncbi:hypothetical protein [Chishuiella sp.]|uniref:hypothetical protein n=1 Tax=Chishuiella sp. TaxID=1969467 RepID=UPI0028B04CC1|nr:hypothetical protein [Chishuiella sp.]